MNFILVIHSHAKLSAQKRSWKCAETLLRSIYTYIYLYKRTCSWQTKIVDNFFKRGMMTFCLMSFCFLTGCQKTIYICNQPVNKISVIEKQASATHPAQFFICGNVYYPCSVVYPRDHLTCDHTSSCSQHQQKRKSYEKPNVTKNCITQ